MKFRYGDKVFENQDELKEFVCQNVDEEYIRDFVDYNYDEFCTNVDEFSPSDIIYQMCGGFEGYRDDEDLFDYLCENCTESDYMGFYAEDYFDNEQTEGMSIADLDFEIIFDEEEIKAHEEEEEEDE